MIWAFMALVALIAVAALLWPLLKTQAAAEPRAAYDLAVFQDQLKELDRDLERGVLTLGEAEAARIEIQRRIITAARTSEPVPASTGGRKAAAAAIGVAVPALAVGIYLLVGTPSLPATVPSPEAHDQDDAQIARMIDQLAAKVAANPNDPQGLALLARSYRQVGKYDEAVAVYRKLLALKPDADSYSSLGEALTAAAGGDVSAEAHGAFFKALTLDSMEPRARFYLGLEFAEKGDAKSAIAIWRDLTASAPPDASWTDMVRQEMSQVAQAAGIPPMTINPAHPLDLLPADGTVVASQAPATPAASAPAPAAPGAEGGFTAEQRQMIEGMVGGLAAKLEQNPDDYNGWMMLGRSYSVLKNTEGATKAYEKAMALKPAEIQPKVQYAALLVMAADQAGKPAPANAVKAVSDALAIDGKQPEALFLSGVAQARAGDKAAARQAFTKAQQAVAADSPLKAEIAKRLEALK